MCPNKSFTLPRSVRLFSFCKVLNLYSKVSDLWKTKKAFPTGKLLFLVSPKGFERFRKQRLISIAYKIFYQIVSQLYHTILKSLNRGCCLKALEYAPLYSRLPLE